MRVSSREHRCEGLTVVPDAGALLPAKLQVHSITTHPQCQALIMHSMEVTM